MVIQMINGLLSTLVYLIMQWLYRYSDLITPIYVSSPYYTILYHRPDWPVVANRFIDHTTTNVPLDLAVVTRSVQFTEFKQYFESGYVVLSDIIPHDILHSALMIVNFWTAKNLLSLSSHPNHNHHHSSNNVYGCRNADSSGRSSFHNRVELSGDINTDLDILALYYATPLVHIMQHMFGANDVKPVKEASIITTYPSLDLVDSPALYGNRWIIDGFTSTGNHSPYSLLIGIALTDIPQYNCGNFCVHPSSHILLMEEYMHHVKQRLTTFSDQSEYISKPDLGETCQVRARNVLYV